MWWSQRGHPRVALSHTLSSPSVVACRRLLVPGGAAVNQAQQAPLSRRKRPINTRTYQLIEVMTLAIICIIKQDGGEMCGFFRSREGLSGPEQQEGASCAERFRPKE